MAPWLTGLNSIHILVTESLSNSDEERPILPPDGLGVGQLLHLDGVCDLCILVPLSRVLDIEDWHLLPHQDRNHSLNIMQGLVLPILSGKVGADGWKSGDDKAILGSFVGAEVGQLWIKRNLVLKDSVQTTMVLLEHHDTAAGPSAAEVMKLVTQDRMTMLDSARMDLRLSEKISKAPQGITWAPFTAPLARQVIFVMWRRMFESPRREKTRTCDIVSDKSSTNQTDGQSNGNRKSSVSTARIPLVALASRYFGHAMLPKANIFFVNMYLFVQITFSRNLSCKSHVLWHFFETYLVKVMFCGIFSKLIL